MKVYAFAVLALTALLVAHVAGGDEGYYYTIASYDIFMHILGGFGIGLAISAMAGSYVPSFFKSRTMVVLGVFIAGLIWELFEAYYGIAGAPVGTKLYWIDTIKDLIDDCLGGAIAAVMTIRAKA